MGENWRHRPVSCRKCGQSGRLSIWSRADGQWGYVLDGFISSGLDRHHPARAKVQCLSCKSGDADLGTEE